MFLEKFGNEMKKQKFKKRKRPKNIRKNGNENVISTISASRPVEPEKSKKKVLSLFYQ